MLSLRPEDILHKSHLQRLLMEIIDQPLLAQYSLRRGAGIALLAKQVLDPGPMKEVVCRSES